MCLDTMKYECTKNLGPISDSYSYLIEKIQGVMEKVFHDVIFKQEYSYN